MGANDLEVRRKRIKYGVLAVAVVGVFGVMAPFLFMALKGAVAAGALAVLGGLTLAFAPAAADMVANWRLKAIKAVARANPIETLENAYIQRVQAWKTREAAINGYATAVRQYVDKARVFVQKYPHKAAEYKEKADGMQKLLYLRRESLQRAADSLHAEKDFIDEKKYEYQMALELARVNAAGADIDERAVMDQLRIDEAMHEIDRASAAAFADLDNITSQIEYDHKRAENLRSLQIPKGQIIDVEAKP